jgi:hypothetical protein
VSLLGLARGEQPGADPGAGRARSQADASIGGGPRHGWNLDLTLGEVAIEQGADQLMGDRLPLDRLCRQAPGAVGPAQEQPSLRPGGGDVGEPTLLLGLALGCALGQLLIVVQPLARPAEAAELDSDASRLAAIRAVLLAGDDPQRGPAELEVAAEVGDRDHPELEPLGGMHRHHPDPRVSLGAGRRLRFAVALCGPGVEVLEEGTQVRSLAGLELAGQPHQLARVGPASGAVRIPHQGFQVVVEARGNAVHQFLQAALGAEGPELDQPTRESTQALELVPGDQLRRLGVADMRLAALGQVADERPDVEELITAVLARGAGRSPQQPERVGEHSASRRGEGPE